MEKGEQDKFDLDGIEAKRIEDARMSNFPLTVEEIEKVTVAVEYNGMFSFFNNCFDIWVEKEQGIPAMDLEESFCFRNCISKLNNSVEAVTIEGTKAERLLKKNLELLKKNDPDFKNIDYDPLKQELDRFKGKFYGGVDHPIV